MSETLVGLLSPSEAGGLLGMTVGALAQLRYTGTGPKFVKLGRTVRYRHEDLIGWVEASLRTSTGGAL